MFSLDELEKNNFVVASGARKDCAILTPVNTCVILVNNMRLESIRIKSNWVEVHFFTHTHETSMYTIENEHLDEKVFTVAKIEETDYDSLKRGLTVQVEQVDEIHKIVAQMRTDASETLSIQCLDHVFVLKLEDTTEYF